MNEELKQTEQQEGFGDCSCWHLRRLLGRESLTSVKVRWHEASSGRGLVKSVREALGRSAPITGRSVLGRL